MINPLISFCLAVGSAISFLRFRRTGMSGLRDKTMMDRRGDEVEGEDAVTIAKFYLFFSWFCLVLAICFLTLTLLQFM